MVVRAATSADHSPVREDWVPKEGYLDRDFAKLEGERLWPRVWQVACREEELPKAGYFVTTDVGKESFLVVRSNDNQIRAFHNVCQHRGRRLVDVVAGRTHHFTCGFHAWRYNMDGSIRQIPDHQDWGTKLPACEVGLKPLKVETWGGFVFVNMDLNAKPLIDFLGHAYEVLDPFEFQNMRYRSIRTARLPVNWKVAVEAFNEGYHVQGTHPQALQIMDDPSSSFAHGPHAMFFQPEVGSRGLGQPSARTNQKPTADYRAGIVNYVEYFERDLKGLFCDRHPVASRRLLTEVEPSAGYPEVMSKMVQFWRDAAIQGGAGWPKHLSPEIMAKAGIDWHIFPNLIILMTPESAICYRVRPDGENPESCFFDLWAIQRYAPGKEPPVTREYYDPWRENKDWGEVYSQDFANAESVQKGMKSRGFAASRTNPKQEVPVSNFHKHIYEYLDRAD
jgi:nitrite reductase/ring-hydroxylating ferredoxin subunit